MYDDKTHGYYISLLFNMLSNYLYNKDITVIAANYSDVFNILDKNKTILLLFGDEWNQIQLLNKLTNQNNIIGIFKTCLQHDNTSITTYKSPIVYMGYNHIAMCDNYKHQKLHSIPLWCFGNPFYLSSDIPISERKYDIFFHGQISNADRRDMQDVLESIKQEKYNTYFKYTTDYAVGDRQSYCEIMNNSKIAICPAGGSGVSVDSNRYWDAQQAGCVIVGCWRPDVWFYNNSYDWRLTKWQELPIVVDKILNDLTTIKTKIEPPISIAEISSSILSKVMYAL
jgi:hypothetical protein